jgi:hypothetical protein
LVQNGTVTIKTRSVRRLGGWKAIQSAVGKPMSRVSAVVSAASPIERPKIWM